MSQKRFYFVYLREFTSRRKKKKKEIQYVGLNVARVRPAITPNRVIYRKMQKSRSILHYDRRMKNFSVVRYSDT